MRNSVVATRALRAAPVVCENSARIRSVLRLRGSSRPVASKGI
jgi:hypothetical protein